jgi:outer membrane protein OmpA-like peptidoglycan-associated protein
MLSISGQLKTGIRIKRAHRRLTVAEALTALCGTTRGSADTPRKASSRVLDAKGGNMADNIQPISGTNAKVAARLCNFPTGDDHLLVDHQNWLDKNVQEVIRGMQGPWVDIKAFASHRGDTRGYDNMGLSQRRCARVKNRVSQYANQVNFQIVCAVGSSESGGNLQNDDGYYRAVEIAVYATKPPAPKPEPVVDGATNFKIRVMHGTSASKFMAQVDAYEFQIIDAKARQAAIYAYGAVGLGLSLLSLPVSTAEKPGPLFSFTTSQPVRLPDFEGSASLYQDPGVSQGRMSTGGTIRLNLTSDNLTQKGARVIPSILPLEGGPGMQFSLGVSASSGAFKLVKIVPFTG